MGPGNLYGEHTTCDSHVPQYLRSVAPNSFFPLSLGLGLRSKSGQKVPALRTKVWGLRVALVM